MKHSRLLPSILVFSCLLQYCQLSPAQEAEPLLDNIWQHATLYENSDNPYIQKFAFSGRLQADYVNFEADQGNHEEFRWRRLRMGFTSRFWEDFIMRVEADFDLNSDAEYQRVTDGYISWNPTGHWSIKALKHSAGFTLDGATSSTKLLTPERNNLTNNLWFDVEYFTGLSVAGTAHGNWHYKAGVFASDGDKQLSDFNSGSFVLLSLGYSLADTMDFQTALVRLDYINNEDHPDAATRELEQVVSLVSEWEQGAWGLRTDLSAAQGFGEQSDLWGLVVMPYYTWSPMFQFVGRYTYIHSSDHNGVRLSRYEKDITGVRGDEYREYFAGVNVYFYGHKLKWQTGVGWARMEDGADDGGAYDDGWGLTTALRVYW